MNELVLLGLLCFFIIVFLAMVNNRCPKCDHPMHRLIDSNTWMCENRDCGYSEHRRGR